MSERDPNGDPSSDEVAALRARLAELSTALADARRTIEALTAKTAAVGRIELLEREIATSQRRLKDISQTGDIVRELRLELRRERAKLARIRKLPGIHIAARLMRILRPMTKRLRAAAKKARDRAKHSEAQAQLAQRGLVSALRHDRASSGPTEGPLVSIVVLTRDGAHHLRRLFGGLRDRTAYRSFEVIVVDNASSDATPTVLRQEWGFPLTVVRNEHNATFSDGNNQGVSVANGELVLLLNNDVDPINDGWLGAMVQTLTGAPERGATGALLVYPNRPRDTPRPRNAPPDLSVQHRGIGFTFVDRAPRARNLGVGEDPRQPRLATSYQVPGATAACLLLRKHDYVAVGGLTSGYVYGTEDVDLCVKLAAANKQVWFCGQAALFHHEFGTQDKLKKEQLRTNRTLNWQMFAHRWGPALSRSIRRDLLSGEGRWTAQSGRTVAITVTQDDPSAGWGDWYTAHELGDAMGELGWRVIYIEGHLDGWYKVTENVNVVISLLDRFDIRRGPQGAYTVAWVRNWTDRWIARPWFEDFDLVLASSQPSADIIAGASEHAAEVLPIATNVARFSPGPPAAELACDFTFTGSNWAGGRGLIASIPVRAGERFALYGRGWESEPSLAAHYRGFLEYDRLPELYRSTKIVIDDAALHTLPYASMNSRVFDAIAAGALVITGNLEGSTELFDGLLPTYTSAEDLRELLDRYLGDEELRAKTVDALRRIVLERHTYAHRARDLVRFASESIERPRLRVRNPASNKAVAESWGDTHFARAFTRGLRKAGFSTAIDLRVDWQEASKQDGDVVLCLRGLHAYPPRPGALNTLWVISHPDDVGSDECAAYDHVFVASESYADHLRSVLDVPVTQLDQATDTSRFMPVPADPDLAARLLFVGSARPGAERPAISWAVELGAPLTVYGKRWEDKLPDGVLRAEYFPNERVQDLYASADIVLSDHWGDMADNGFVSNRVFDALACGAFVISDHVTGIEHLFGDAVPTFSTKEELGALLDRYVDDPAERRRLAEAGMAIVRDKHSFDVRARQFTDAIAAQLAARPRSIEDMAARA
jgi:O-antigen biosynthesis protein